MYPMDYRVNYGDGSVSYGMSRDLAEAELARVAADRPRARLQQLRSVLLPPALTAGIGATMPPTTGPKWLRDGWRPAGPGFCRCPKCGDKVSTNALARAKHRCKTPKPENKP